MMNTYPRILLSLTHLAALVTTLFCCVELAVGQAASSDQESTTKLKITDDGKSLQVMLDEDLFTRYDYSTFKKPIFFPVMGPKQIPMTRNYPMKKIEGESTDHPHHKSMWIGHEFNGIDFWTEKGGRVKTTKVQINNDSTFAAWHSWISKANDQVIVRDEVLVKFEATDQFRSIEYQVKFRAEDHDVKFDDTKEGFFAVRVHPLLRLTSKGGGRNGSPDAKMTNSTGESGKQIWGKPARWVDYSGVIDGQSCGVAILDHPGNLRHPTTWHARDYGLLAANPFGLHYFAKQPKHAGQHTLKRGDEIVFRYKVLLHLGSCHPDQLNRAFKKFAAVRDDDK